MQLQVGQIVEMKKKHPCGSNRWILERVGADIRLKCIGCERTIMQPRRVVEKSIKTIDNTDKQ